MWLAHTIAEGPTVAVNRTQPPAAGCGGGASVPVSRTLERPGSGAGQPGLATGGLKSLSADLH
jgi:hypothetical protein